MDSPYLESGESIILTTDRISINSLQYDMLLTTRYLILVDIRYAQVQPQKIPLLEIHSVKGGTVTTGDLVITLFFFDADRTGSTQANLIFSRQPDEQRDRERDEWLRRLMEFIVLARQEIAGTSQAATTQVTGIRPAKRRMVAPEMQPPHTTVINTRPEPVELTVTHDEGRHPFFPADTGHEAGPAEEPVEERATGTEPENATPDRASFGETEISRPQILPAGPPESLREGEAEIPEEEEAALDSIPSGEPQITQPAVSEEHADITGIPDSVSSRDDEGGPGPDEIPGAIPPGEPDITRTQIPSEEHVNITGIPDSISPKEEEAGPAQAASTVMSELPEPASTESVVIQAGEPGPAEKISPDERGTPESAVQPAAGTQANAPGSPPPVTGPARRSFILVAAVIILILGAFGSAVLYSDYPSAPGRGIPPAPTPAAPETIPSTSQVQGTPVPSPVIIPANGVWVRVVYPRSYYGRLGNPGSLRGINGSGDQFYQVSEADRLVQAQVYKRDNSGDQLSVGIYRNGTLISRRVTSSPMGYIELLIDATTGNAPGISPSITSTTAQPANRAGNQTSPVVNRTITVTSTPVRPVVNESVTNTSNQTGSGSRVLYF